MKIEPAAAAARAKVHVRKRNPARTRQAILKAAVVEFCRHGFKGARVEAISKRSKINMRLLYHYFDNKEGLYMAVLERVYSQIRAEERKLSLTDLDPPQGMRRLIDFTFSFFGAHQDYISLMNSENLLRARYLSRSRQTRSLTIPLVAAIENLLARGQAMKLFRKDVDPVQLYVSIVALSYFHNSNRHTLSAIFDRDLGDPAWLEERRVHAQDLLMSWLTATASQRGVAAARRR